MSKHMRESQLIKVCVSTEKFGLMEIFSNKKNYARKIKNAFKNMDLMMDELEVYNPTGAKRWIARVMLKEQHAKEWFYGVLKFKKGCGEEYRKTMEAYMAKPSIVAEPLGYGKSEDVSFIATRAISGIPMNFVKFGEMAERDVEVMIIESALFLARLHNPPLIFHGDLNFKNMILSANSEKNRLIVAVDWEKMQKPDGKINIEKYGLEIITFAIAALNARMIGSKKSAERLIDYYRVALKDADVASNIHEIIKKVAKTHPRFKLPEEILNGLIQPLVRPI